MQSSLEENQTQHPDTDRSDKALRPDALKEKDFSDKIAYAFQLATAQGPLCSEPCQGIVVFVEEVTVAAIPNDDSSSREMLGRLTGEVIKTVRDSIRQGFLDWSPRLLLAMYSCEIQASSTSHTTSRSLHFFF